ncbi:MAG: hypothetical protein ABW221_10495 [Vicinamibacteria bacterium]
MDRPAVRTFALVSVPAALLVHGLARAVDGAVGVLLHTSLDLPSFVATALGLIDRGDAALQALAWAAAGTAVWAALAALRRRGTAEAWNDALAAEAPRFAVLLLRPALTALALGALALQPTYPYGFTLPVALTQDWGVAQDAAALLAFLLYRLPVRALPAPGTASLTFLAFLAYAFLSPPWALRWESHPGNEPKTLRMAVALGHWWTLDVEGVSGPMEQLPARPLLQNAAASAAALGRESARMLASLAHGPDAVGRAAIRATRVTRQTIRGKEGGTYHVLAPGPSFLLAPTLRLDRALNLRRGTEGRLAITLLAWNALAALLVGATYQLARAASGRPGLAAAVAAGAALVPPSVFYSFQFYPEMLGALVMTAALRALLFGRPATARSAIALGLALATLPWLHQKFLPVWLALALWALVRAVSDLVPLRTLAALVLPQAVSLYLTALYNYAITGSVRPDALFLAWGPGGVSSSRIGQGLFGLALDARFGLFPYVPFLLLAMAGLALPAGRRLRAALPVAAIYYLTVASADNWSGAVCNLGRYIMPVVPLLLAAAAVALARVAWRRPGVWLVAGALAAWSALLARLLWQDAHAANDCALLLARSAIADGNVYVPNLFIRTWADAAPGLGARIAAWTAFPALLAVWMRRAQAGRGGASAVRALAGLAAVVVLAAAVLERWPATRTRAQWPDALALADGSTVFFAGAARAEGEGVRARSGTVELLVRSGTARETVTLVADGTGLLRIGDGAPVVLAGRPLTLRVPLDRVATLTGRRGAAEALGRQVVRVASGPGIAIAVLP